jgi:hypothetical protein
MYREPGLAWLERQAEVAEELVAQPKRTAQNRPGSGPVWVERLELHRPAHRRIASLTRPESRIRLLRHGRNALVRWAVLLQEVLP